MENYEINSLREWAPLTEVIEKIPPRIQKGIFSSNLNVTCIDVIPEYIALGTDAGIVFWYNRFSGEVQKLRAEVPSPISCVRVVSSVEYMVAAGSINGQVSVFQIQKELPPDLDLAGPLTKAKPIERYTIRDLHKSIVTCCEWSKNGMKLFSGDKQGIVVLTEFDYQAHLSKSVEILNEAYDIVQLSVNQSYFLVSTVFRSIICQRDQSDRWRISQIGKKDRKILSEFGATFVDIKSKPPKIICARPGLRFWIADSNGNVEQTLLFKDAAAVKPIWDIPLLNPGKTSSKALNNFSKIFMYTKNYVITYDDNILYIVNLEKLRIEATARGFRNILDVSLCGNEIFILEGARSLVRISTSPEPPSKTSKIIFNPMLPPPLPLMPSSPIEFEAEEDAIINAEECFELPAVEHIDLDIPIETALDSPTTQKNKVIIEQNKRIEVFDKINEMEFEESILYRSGISKKQKKEGKQSSKRKPKNGIVEIGQAVEETSQTKVSSPTKDGQKLELTTRPEIMDASFCTNPAGVPESHPEDDDTNSVDSNTGSLSDILNLAPVKLDEVANDEIKLKEISEQNTLSTIQYPLNFSATTTTPSVDDAEVQTTPRKKLHFINDDEDLSPSTENTKIEDFTSFYQGVNDAMTQAYPSTSSTSFQTPEETRKPMKFVPCQLLDTPTTSNVPEVQKIPEYMKIPTLWNVNIEKSEDSDQSGSQNSGDWELVDA